MGRVSEEDPTPDLRSAYECGDVCRLFARDDIAEVVDGVLQTGSQQDLRLPVEVPAGERRVRTSLLRVVLRQVHLHQLAAALGDQLQNHLCELTDGEFAGVAEVDRAGRLRLAHHPKHAFDEVVDILEAAGLLAVTVDGDVLVLQCLNDEVRHHATVIRLHLRPVGVEDADDTNVRVVGALVVEEQAFGVHLAHVVARADARDADVATVVLRLRVNEGVPVHLAGGGLQDTSTGARRQVEHVHGTHEVGLARHDRVELVVRG